MGEPLKAEMKKQPNIVFIITDQQRFDTINALGFDHMITPNLDRQAARGKEPSVFMSATSLRTRIEIIPHCRFIWITGTRAISSTVKSSQVE